MHRGWALLLGSPLYALGLLLLTSFHWWPSLPGGGPLNLVSALGLAALGGLTLLHGAAVLLVREGIRVDPAAHSVISWWAVPGLRGERVWTGAELGRLRLQTVRARSHHPPRFEIDLLAGGKWVHLESYVDRVSARATAQALASALELDLEDGAS